MLVEAHATVGRDRDVPVVGGHDEERLGVADPIEEFAPEREVEGGDFRGVLVARFAVFVGHGVDKVPVQSQERGTALEPLEMTPVSYTHLTLPTNREV